MKNTNETQDGIELNDHTFVDGNRRGAIMNDYIAMDTNIVDEYIDVEIPSTVNNNDGNVVSSPWLKKLEEVSLPEFHGGVVIPLMKIYLFFKL
jgi:hypothetical protein